MTNEGIPSELLGEMPKQEVDISQPPLAEQKEVDINQLILQIGSRISEFQMFIIHLQNKMAQMEKNLAYLLSKDPEYMKAFEKMQEVVKQAHESEAESSGAELNVEEISQKE